MENIMNDHTLFISYRKEALQLWLKETGRKKYFRARGNFEGGFECKWQAFTEHDEHLNFCCGFGEFCCIITDILTDTRNDKIDIVDFEAESYHESSLYRYYLNFYLVVDQILEDFKKIGGWYKLYDPNDLRGFINTFVKHKNGKIHCFYNKNNHIPKFFENTEIINSKPLDIINSKPLDIINWKYYKEDKDINKYDYFLLPSLKYGIEIIVQNYKNLDVALSQTENKKKFITKYLSTNN